MFMLRNSSVYSDGSNLLGFKSQRKDEEELLTPGFKDKLKSISNDDDSN